MTPLEKIKGRIEELYKSAPDIRMDVTLSRPRLNLRDAAATITAVYPHTFQIKEAESGKPHILQYTDILIGSIVIKEFDLNTVV